VECGDKMYKPKITIITAAFNAGKTIGQTICSVLSQDYENIEYIIVDGGSTDNTLKILNRYKCDRRLHYISEKDSGIYNALNKAVALASGDYIEVLGADDALAGNTVISSVSSELSDDIDVWSGLVYGVDEETCRQRIIGDNHIARDRNKYKGGMIAHSGMFVKKKLLLKYPFDETYKIAADYKFFLQCYNDENIKFKFSDLVVSYFSLAGVSSKDNACDLENARIYRELGLPYYDVIIYDDSKVKYILKVLLTKMFMYDVALCLYKRFAKYFWSKHACLNKVCRWCGRNNL